MEDRETSFPPHPVAARDRGPVWPWIAVGTLLLGNLGLTVWILVRTEAANRLAQRDPASLNNASAAAAPLEKQALDRVFAGVDMLEKMKEELRAQTPPNLEPPRQEKPRFTFSSIAVLAVATNLQEMARDDTVKRPGRVELIRLVKKEMGTVAPALAALLSKSGKLRVIPPEPTADGPEKSEPTAIGKTLKAETVLTGEVYDTGQYSLPFLKVTLIDVPTGFPVWTDQYPLTGDNFLENVGLIGIQKVLPGIVSKVIEAVLPFAAPPKG